MEKEGAIELLPEPYAKALTLKGEGLNEEEIAKELGIETESVDPFLKLAEAKLANLLSEQTIDLIEETTRAGSDE
jgi:DNA-directed RNA polymerase specialized sigma24 family protein